MNPNTVQLDTLFRLKPAPDESAVFRVAGRRRGGRWRVEMAHPTGVSMAPGSSRRWAIPLPCVGDSPQLYHPLYAMATLGVSHDVTSRLTERTTGSLAQWPLPAVVWTTDADVRRSMALNGMRMSTEYWQSGSLRVLQLVESRLIEGQRDVVHDVLVYLMRQILDIRTEAEEARGLRAESVAAYLGLQEAPVRALFASDALAPARMAAAIDGGIAGPVRRALNVGELVAAQVRQLRPQLREYSQQENRWLWLIDEITQRLYDDAPG